VKRLVPETGVRGTSSGKIRTEEAPPPPGTRRVATVADWQDRFPEPTQDELVAYLLGRPDLPVIEVRLSRERRRQHDAATGAYPGRWRGRCPTCGEWILLRLNGRLRSHSRPGERWTGRRCDGSGSVPPGWRRDQG
jgi:hypothetical protein